MLRLKNEMGLFSNIPQYSLLTLQNFAWALFSISLGATVSPKRNWKLQINYAYAYAKFGKDNTEYYDIFWKRLYCTSTGHNSITTLVFTSQGFINPLY